jgi:hypothetical protein
MGEVKKAEALLQRSLKSVAAQAAESADDYGLSLARIHALSGRTDAAVAALRETIEAEWDFHWWFYLKLDPALDPVRNDPRFQLMVEAMNTQMARRLANVRQHEASGQVVLPSGA